MNGRGGWKSLVVGVLTAAALVVLAVAPGRAQERRGESQAAVAAVAAETAQRAALAESILAAKEQGLGEGFDPAIRAYLQQRMEALSIDQLVALAAEGEPANIPNALGDAAADLVYTPVTPCRVFDTRSGGGAIPANTQRNFEVAGTVNFPAQGGLSGGCGIPTGATSVILNFTAVNATAPGDLRAWAVASPQPAAPTASVVNWAAVPGLAIANGIAVPICNPAATSCTLGDLRVQADASAIDIVGDVVGYFRAPTYATTSVPGRLVASYATAAGGNSPTATTAFIGPTYTIALAQTQRVHWVVNKALGSTLVGGATALDLYPCTQLSPAAIVTYDGGIFDLRVAQNQRIVSGVQWVQSLSAGTYTVGMCGNSTNAASWNNNEWGYIAILVFNTP